MTIFAMWICLTSTSAYCHFAYGLHSTDECAAVFSQVKAKVSTARILVPCYASVTLPPTDYVLAR